MCDVGIFFASIGGRTRRVSALLAQGLQPARVELFDLRVSSQDDLGCCRLTILGSPTYGAGDLHHLWHDWADRLLAARPQLGEVAIFALGDRKHHGATFAGALRHLADLTDALGASRIGELPGSDVGNFPGCESLLRNGRLPGLVLDDVSQHALIAGRAAAWARQILSESRAIRDSVKAVERTLSEVRSANGAS